MKAASIAKLEDHGSEHLRAGHAGAAMRWLAACAILATASGCHGAPAPAASPEAGRGGSTPPPASSLAQPAPTVTIAPVSSAAASGSDGPPPSASAAPRLDAPKVGGSVTLGRAKLEYRFPGTAWTPEPPKSNNGVRAWGFSREPIDDAAGRHVIPYVAIIVEELDAPTDVVVYSLQKRLKTPFKADRVFNWQDEPRLLLKNAVAFEGNVSYPDSADPKTLLLHRLVILHAVQGRYGIMVIADSTDSVYATTHDEFLELLWSLSIDPGKPGGG